MFPLAARVSQRVGPETSSEIDQTSPFKASLALSKRNLPRRVRSALSGYRGLGICRAARLSRIANVRLETTRIHAPCLGKANGKFERATGGRPQVADLKRRFRVPPQSGLEPTPLSRPATGPARLPQQDIAAVPATCFGNAGQSDFVPTHKTNPDPHRTLHPPRPPPRRLQYNRGRRGRQAPENRGLAHTCESIARFPGFRVIRVRNL